MLKYFIFTLKLKDKQMKKNIILLATVALFVAFTGCDEDDKTFTVFFDSNGGSDVAAQTISEGKKAAKPSPDPTKVDYGFEGWYKDNESFEYKWDFNTSVVENLTLYAKWDIIPVISSFSPDEAAHSATLTITGKNFSATLSENIVTLNGFPANVISATSDTIEIIVPKNLLCSGVVSVTVAGKTGKSVTPFTYLPTYVVSTFASDFYYPAGIAIDSKGNIYVADESNHRIRKMTPDGTVTTFAGSGAAGNNDGLGTAAQFHIPTGIAIDAADNLYVTDYNSHLIRKITSNGMVTTIAGNGFAGNADGVGTAAQFYSPFAITIDAMGNLFVADQLNHRIRKITPDGEVTTLAGSTQGYADGVGTTVKFDRPSGIAIDATGNIYVGDADNHLIRKITKEGTVTTFAGNGVAGDADGIGTSAQFFHPVGIAIDPIGNLYVGDVDNNRIRKIMPNGTVTTFVGSSQGHADGIGSIARFHDPYCIAIDDAGNFYVSDFRNHCIRKIVAE